MSPEANKPETQTGSDQFVEGYHPTDRVRPFKKGALADVHDDLQERGVPDTAPIDSDSLEVPVDKIPLSSDAQLAHTEADSTDAESRSGWRKWVAGVVGGAVLAGGGFALHQATQEDTGRPVDSTSATPDVGGEAEASPEDVEAKTPEQLVGTIVNDNINRLNARPTEALLEELKSPILASEHSGEEAAVLASKKIHAYYLSGDTTVVTNDGGKLITLTPESAASGNEQLSTIFSKDVDVTSTSFDWMRGVRGNISDRLNYYGTSKQYNLETSQSEYATLADVFTPQETVAPSPEESITTMQIDQITNFEALDRDDLYDHPEIDTNQTFYMAVTMVVENGEWRVKSFAPAQ